MTYSFDISQIEILNHLIFDASVDFEQINKLTTQNQTIEFNIERRTFESVTRKKILFWTKTYLNGKKSLLQFTDINNFSIAGVNENFKDNHFINSITADKSNNVIMTTVFGLTITLNVGNNFKASDLTTHLRYTLTKK